MFGPGALELSPVDNKIPSAKGKVEPFLLKYPIPLVDPKLVPVEEVILVMVAHVELNNTFCTSCGIVYNVELVVIGGGIVPIHTSKVEV